MISFLQFCLLRCPKKQGFNRQLFTRTETQTCTKILFLCRDMAEQEWKNPSKSKVCEPQTELNQVKLLKETMNASCSGKWSAQKWYWNQISYLVPVFIKAFAKTQVGLAKATFAGLIERSFIMFDYCLWFPSGPMSGCWIWSPENFH